MQSSKNKGLTLTEKQFNAILDDYKAKYDIENLSSPNDLANLYDIIHNTIIIRDLQSKMGEMIQQDIMTNSTQMSRVTNIMSELKDLNLKIEKQLNIDRKTRKQEADVNPADYIAGLKKHAKEFLNDPRRLTRVYCKACKILIGRISGVYDTTEFNAKFQCIQCKKFTTVVRKEKDIFFDVRDADWRRQYPMEIIQPKKGAAPEIDQVSDEVILGEDDIIFDGE